MHQARALGGVALLLVLAWTVTARPAIGAGPATTVVSAAVAPATSLDTSGCLSAAATRLGPVPVGNWAIGDPCSIGFGSSNSGARLSMTQRDRTGTAMESVASDWTAISGSTNWYSATGFGDGVAWIGGAGGPGEPSSRFQYTTDGGAS